MLAELTAHIRDPGLCDLCHNLSTCSRCEGSGVGPDPALKCHACGGTGLDSQFNRGEVHDWWEESDLLNFVGAGM